MCLTQEGLTPKKPLISYRMIISMVSCWHHDMKTLSSLLAICAENPPDTGVFFPSQRGSYAKLSSLILLLLSWSCWKTVELSVIWDWCLCDVTVMNASIWYLHSIIRSTQVFHKVINLFDMRKILMHCTKLYIDRLVQERCNSIANALELLLSCTNPSIYPLPLEIS